MWFTRELFPGLAGSCPPCVVLVGGGTNDVAGLEPLAERQVVLGLRLTEAVVAEIHAINTAIADRLHKRELELHADAITTPSLLNGLPNLLPRAVISRSADRIEGSE